MPTLPHRACTNEAVPACRRQALLNHLTPADHTDDETATTARLADSESDRWLEDRRRSAAESKLGGSLLYLVKGRIEAYERIDGGASVTDARLHAFLAGERPISPSPA